MEMLPKPTSMDEYRLRELGKKLVRFRLVSSFTVVDSQGLNFDTVNKYPQAIIQNTKSREDFKTFNGLSGHWVCYFITRDGCKTKSYFYDSLGYPESRYNINSPPFTVRVTSLQHQSNNSRLCSLFTLYFLVGMSIGYSPNQIFKVMNKTQLDINDQLMFEFYNIFQTASSRRKLIRSFTMLHQNWCKVCGSMFCNCKVKGIKINTI